MSRFSTNARWVQGRWIKCNEHRGARVELVRLDGDIRPLIRIASRWTRLCRRVALLERGEVLKVDFKAATVRPSGVALLQAASRLGMSVGHTWNGTNLYVWRLPASRR